jgi:hypothetical protein
MADEQPSSGDGGAGAQPDIRASHADRDQVVEILREAAGEGRLTVEELDERVEAALSARTVGELAGLTRDLPVPSRPAEAEAQARDVVEIDQRWGTLRRAGAWAVPRRLHIRMRGGDVRLDFTEAVIGHGTLDLEVDIGIGGDLVLVTRPGVEVTTGGLTVNGGDLKVRTPDPAPDAPADLRVHVAGRVHGDVVVRYPRRTLGQWMRGESAL